MASEEDLTNYYTGTHEVQECLEGQCEVDLHTHMKHCTKNRDHEGFVPVNQLSLDQFLPGYYGNDLCNLTKVMADLTVRIAVKFTSPDRPEFVPGTKCPYPCYNTRGHKSLHTGTGRVVGVTKYTEKMDHPYLNYRTCPCPECDHSDTPSEEWWEIVVWTANHVVFDTNEAKQTIFRLWFDDDKSPVVNIYGWRVEMLPDAGRDLSVVYCVTHDLDVGDKLKEMLGRFNVLCKKVSDKHKSRGDDVDKLTIIVSHPHGCSKQVSVGHWVDRIVVWGIETMYTYNTSTCPGSSGAAIYRLGCKNPHHPHCGAGIRNLNYSGVWWD